jgi:adenylate cyclase
MALNGAPENCLPAEGRQMGSHTDFLLGSLFWVAGTFDERRAGANFKLLHYLSYDALSLIRPTIEITNAVIVAMDEDSYENLKQKPGELWDRTLHARLLDTLFTRGARMVVFDIVFAGPWPDQNADEQLEAALKRSQGKVILAETQLQFEEIGEIGGSRENLRPLERFSAVAPVGVAEVTRDADGRIRRYPSYPQTHLAWKAAETLGISLPTEEQHRWINYYGPPGTIRPVSYFKALQFEGLPPDIFSNKVVFVGKHRVITARGASRGDDEFSTLYRVGPVIGIVAWKSRRRFLQICYAASGSNS